MKTRIVVTVITLILWVIAIQVYGMFQGPIESSAAVGQLKDDAVSYGAARAAAGGLYKAIINWFCVLVLAVTWVSFLFKKTRDSGNSNNLGATCLLFGISLFATGCVGPYQKEVIEEIGPNETAFLVPLEGASNADQGKFMSVEYLNKAKVATKRVTIPTRKIETGRGSGAYEWIPTMKLIKVNRAPVTREWTKAAESGTSSKDQAISVESNESIDFYLGVVGEGSVKEEDAAIYLYNFAGKTVDEVMDNNVRGYVQKALFEQFGQRSLTQGKQSKKDIFDQTEKATKAYFAARGLTIGYIGGAEGLTYKDANVQAAINKAFIAENEKKVAVEEQAAQVTRNQTNVAMATAQRQAAEEFAKAKDAQTAKVMLDIKMVYAEGFREMAKRYSGGVPSVVPQGLQTFFGLSGMFPSDAGIEGTQIPLRPKK